MYLVLSFDHNIFEDTVMATEHPFLLEEHHTCLYSFHVLIRVEVLGILSVSSVYKS